MTGAALYEIWEEDNPLFVDANSNAGSGWTLSWPGDSIQAFDNSTSDGTTFYYKVRAWTAAPEDGGACSLWSDVRSIIIDILDAPVLDDITDDDDNGAYDGSYTGSKPGAGLPSTAASPQVGAPPEASPMMPAARGVLSDP